jgi:protein-S-isoprenylcysteine O-methyltransferase Ste14
MWKHFRTILLLPGVVTVVVPAMIIYRTGIEPFSSTPRILVALLGVMLVGAGLVLLAATNRHFAKIGKGTLAPWNPTSQLVVEGVYRHVRNPMISGVFAILLGDRKSVV